MDTFNVNQMEDIIETTKLKSNILFISSLEHIQHSNDTSIIIDMLTDQSESEKQINIYHHLFSSDIYYHILPFRNNHFNMKGIYSLYIAENDNLNINDILEEGLENIDYEEKLLYFFLLFI